MVKFFQKMLNNGFPLFSEINPLTHVGFCFTYFFKETSLYYIGNTYFIVENTNE